VRDLQKHETADRNAATRCYETLRRYVLPESHLRRPV